MLQRGVNCSLSQSARLPDGELPRRPVHGDDEPGRKKGREEAEFQKVLRHRIATDTRIFYFSASCAKVDERNEALNNLPLSFLKLANFSYHGIEVSPRGLLELTN